MYVSNESREVTVINGAPPGYTSCDSVGRLPGCLFKFDEPDAQCSSGRSGRPFELPAWSLSTSFNIRSHSWYCIFNCTYVYTYMTSWTTECQLLSGSFRSIRPVTKNIATQSFSSPLFNS